MQLHSEHFWKKKATALWFFVQKHENVNVTTCLLAVSPLDSALLCSHLGAIMHFVDLLLRS